METNSIEAVDAAPIKMSWGIMPPEGTFTAWGARAIYKPCRLNYNKAIRGKWIPAEIDLLYDRQSAKGDDKALKGLSTWMNKVALPKLRKTCSLSSSSEETVTIENDKFKLVASPKGSFGYLYIGAWVK